MLQAFISLSKKTYNMLPQRDVVLKVTLCAMLLEHNIVALKISSCNNTFRGEEFSSHANNTQDLGNSYDLRVI